MKEYRLEGKDNIDDEWWVIDYYNSLEEANERIKYEQYLDEDCENKEWEYRILSREVSEWKAVE